MKKILASIFIALLFFNISCEEHSNILMQENKEVNETRDNDSPANLAEAYFQYEEWDSASESEGTYENGGKIIQFKN
ncbi:MAG TPA: hypothetical protein VK325_01790 [Pseudoxanthomonas sp.]|nr:hypothetical protein [Pseudoxanthomonas sp.]